VNVDDIKLMQNTFTGPGHAGVQLWNVSDAKVLHNTVEGFLWGIFIASFSNGVSNNNMIQGNTVTGTTYASCIGFQGDTDYNTVMNNTVTNNFNIANAGIMFYNYMAEGFIGNNNVVRNNVVTDNTLVGIWITTGGMDNTIGPNNNVSNNASWGIYLSSYSEGNHVFNNTAKGNGCDIGNDGINNTFRNNKADCTSGV
jgi:parallel beta-helix repeat protein